MSQGFDVNQGIYTLTTPDEDEFIIARDTEGVPVALFFTSQDKAEKYLQAMKKTQAKVLHLEGRDGVLEITEDLLDGGVKEAFLDQAPRTRKPTVLNLEDWLSKQPEYQESV
jgi:hypothetical protein